MLNPIVWLILQILDIYWWVVIVAVVASWLVVGGVINIYNPLANKILHILNVLTEPVFSLIRRVIPPIAGLDLSPLVVLFGIQFLKYAVIWLTSRLFFMM